MDYFQSVWEERIDECVRNIELAMVVSGETMPSFAGELNGIRAMINNLRDVPERYDEHIDRLDLDLIADSMRDSIVSLVARLIRTFQASKDEIISQIEHLQYVVASVGPR